MHKLSINCRVKPDYTYSARNAAHRAFFCLFNIQVEYKKFQRADRCVNAKKLSYKTSFATSKQRIRSSKDFI